jgi:hypothetical protein
MYASNYRVPVCARKCCVQHFCVLSWAVHGVVSSSPPFLVDCTYYTVRYVASTLLRQYLIQLGLQCTIRLSTGLVMFRYVE